MSGPCDRCMSEFNKGLGMGLYYGFMFGMLTVAFLLFFFARNQ